MNGLRRELLYSVLLLFIHVNVCVMKVTKSPPMTAQKVVPDSKDDVVEIGLDKMKELFSTILTGYDKRIRPRDDQDLTVFVNSTFVLNNVLEFDTQDQKFSVLGYFRISWNDDFLVWDPSMYTGTNTIRIPINEIWTPKVVYIKAYDGDGTVGEAEVDIAKVSNTGHVQWVPDGTYSVVCEVDIRYFPFDVQECSFTFHVADETVLSVELVHEVTVDLSEYLQNSEWDLVNGHCNLVSKSNNNFIDLRFRMKRRGDFIMFTVIAPLLMLAFLNGCVFLVPVNSGEKGSFAITVFLSYGIFVTVVMETLPHNSLQVSNFILFIVALLSISVLLVLYTIIQSKVFHDFGQAVCSIGCLKKRGDVLKEDGSDQSYTWAVFMERLDIILFFIFIFLVASCSGIFMVSIYFKF